MRQLVTPICIRFPTVRTASFTSFRRSDLSGSAIHKLTVTSEIGKRAFSYSAPSVCRAYNDLPSSLRSFQTLVTFQSHLKAYFLGSQLSIPCRLATVRTSDSSLCNAWLLWCYRHCSRSMRSRVYEIVEHRSVWLSVRLINRPPHAAAAGLLLWARWPGDI